MYFKKSGPEVKEMNKPVLPDKQRNIPKIRQSSPMKCRDTHNSSQNIIRKQSTATNNQDDNEESLEILEIESAI
jgi:hypothetical protein